LTQRVQTSLKRHFSTSEPAKLIARRNLFTEFESELKALASGSETEADAQKELKSVLHQLQKALENDVLVAKLSSNALLKKEFFRQLLGRVVQLPSINASKQSADTFPLEMKRAVSGFAGPGVQSEVSPVQTPATAQDAASVATSEYGELGVFDVSSEENTKLSLDIAKLTNDMISEDVRSIIRTPIA
jgi:hypothetical protein